MSHVPSALVAAVVICGAVAALGQPRPAVAALLSCLAISTVTGRRFALLACVAIAVGLIAASPPHQHERPVVQRR